MILAPLDPMWWADRALCRDGDPDAMFPEGGTARRRAAERRAARACGDCPCGPSVCCTRCSTGKSTACGAA